MNCQHLTLRKLDDQQIQVFPSFKEGWRLYQCEECGELLKANVAVAHPVSNG